jgi:DNA-binding transcriptional MocR family regulator
VNNRLAWRVAVRDSSLDATAKHVALTLDIYMNRHGIAWPSRSSLAAGCSCSVKTVARAVARLERAGFVEVKRGHGRRSNLYLGVIPRGDTGVPTTGALVGTLTTAMGTLSPRSGDTGVPRSRKEVVIKKGKDDRARDQVKTGVDPEMVELAHGWLRNP